MARQGRRLQLFIEVNTGEEPQKAGVMPKEAAALLRLCREELKLDIAGLMCIPPLDEEPAVHFAFLAKLARELGLADLSMGMSADFETAIAFGATHVRVGSEIFGARGGPALTPPEQALDVGELQLHVGGAAVVALAGAGRGLHLAQQRVHLLGRRAGGPRARCRGRPWSSTRPPAAPRAGCPALAERLARKIAHQALDVGVAEQRRHLAHQHGAGPERLQRQAPARQVAGALGQRRRLVARRARRSRGSAGPAAPRRRWPARPSGARRPGARGRRAGRR